MSPFGKLLHATPLAATLLCATTAVSASPVNWADWTSGTTGDNATATGVFNTANNTAVGISYIGEVAFIQTGSGTNYFTHSGASPYTSGLVDNDPLPSEMIALSRASSKTLTFSQSVDNLFFAVVSLNGNGYRFNQDFDVVSTGLGYWGNGTLTKVDLGNGQFELDGTGEPHGVIRFTGSVSSITWTSLTDENWNGFTVGTYGVAAAVPEPETYALMLAGLVGVGAAARSRARRG